MKIIKQVGIIFAICWLSQVVESILPIAFPASVIGMILLFALLVTGILKIEHVQEKSDFLLSNMSFFFIPVGVSLINYLDILKNNIFQLLIICAISTVTTFAATVYTVKFVSNIMNRRKKS